MSRILYFETISAAYLSMLMAAPVLARPSEDDAQTVDSEERLTTEAFIDIPSYRPRPSWQSVFDDSDNGFRTSAGSLTMTRFAYDEELRLSSALDQPLTVGLSRNTIQTTATGDLDQEVRAQLNVFREGAKGMHLAALGDCDTFKKYGDLGMAIGAHDLHRRRIEAYFWSVDHYFNSKGPVGVRYTRQPASIGFRGMRDFARSVLAWDVRWDSPLTLRDRNVDSEYHRTQHLADVTWTRPVGSHYRVR